MKHYFLVAKDVGDLTRILCAALEDEQAKAAPGLERRHQAVSRGASARSPARSISSTTRAASRSPAPDVFRKDPVNIIRLFHLADIHGLEFHPDALKRVTRSLKLINAGLRENEEANRLFLSILTSRRQPGAHPEAHERGRRARPLHSRLRQDRLDDAVQHVSPLYGGRASPARRRRAVAHREGRGGRRPSACHAADARGRGPRGALRRRAPARRRQGPAGGPLDGRARRWRAGSARASA